MKLRDELPKDRNAAIRIFSGPQTIFNGKRNDIPDKSWNLRVGPYMDCTVLHKADVDGVVTIVI